MVTHSFMILAYGRSDYLEACIQSLINQSVKSKIVICTSTPNTHISKIAERYNINLRINPSKHGIANDWNFAMGHVDTPYFTLAHQDDIYLSGYSETSIKRVAELSLEDPIILFSPTKLIIQDQLISFSLKNIIRWLLVFPFHFKRSISNKFFKKFILMFGNSISCPGVFFVKDKIPDHLFDTHLNYVLDWKAWYELSKLDGAFIYYPKPLHCHREHRQSSTRAIRKNELVNEDKYMFDLIWGKSLISSILTYLHSFIK